MKLMIASDIHGSAYYCEKLLKAYDEEKADKLLLLGDILNTNAQFLSRELAALGITVHFQTVVIAMLNPRKQDLLCVRGNCDTEVDQMVLEFPILADYCILYLNERMIFATHGHVFNEKNLPQLKKGDILLHGHTHVPVCKETEDYIYLNPGSVSIPKENSWHGYMILEDGTFFWKDLEGNVQKEFCPQL